MALKATIYKAELNVSDMDRHYYGSHQLTLARHPSESDERMMLRTLAYAIYASEQLEFGKGLSSDEEPDLWERDLSGTITRWIDLGQPSVKRVQKACGRASEVVLFTYGGGSADNWWKQNADALARFDNLTVLKIEPEHSAALAALASRNMQLHCTIQDGDILMGDDTVNIELKLIAC